MSKRTGRRSARPRKKGAKASKPDVASPAVAGAAPDADDASERDDRSDDASAATPETAERPTSQAEDDEDEPADLLVVDERDRSRERPTTPAIAAPVEEPLPPEPAPATPPADRERLLEVALRRARGELTRLQALRERAEARADEADRRVARLREQLETESMRAAELASRREAAVAAVALSETELDRADTIERLEDEVLVLKRRLEGERARSAFREAALRLELQAEVSRVRERARAAARQQASALLKRVEERGRAELEQLRAELERLRATPSEPAGPAVGGEELEARMRRAVLDAEKTALAATEALAWTEERARQEIERAHAEVGRLRAELEGLKRSGSESTEAREELRKTRSELEELRDRLLAATEAALSGLPGRGSGAGLLEAAGLDGPPPLPAGPPVPKRPPRPVFVKATKMISAGMSAVWHDNAQEVAEVRIGGRDANDSAITPRRALRPEDLESDPALRASKEPDDPAPRSPDSSDGSFDPEDWDDF